MGKYFVFGKPIFVFKCFVTDFTSENKYRPSNTKYLPIKFKIRQITNVIFVGEYLSKKVVLQFMLKFIRRKKFSHANFVDLLMDKSVISMDTSTKSIQGTNIQNVNFAQGNLFVAVYSNIQGIFKFIRRKKIALANFVDLSMLIKVI
jgi:hypothetical protein